MEGIVAAAQLGCGRLEADLFEVPFQDKRGEPPDSGTAATAAEPALQILEGKAMLRGPCLKLRDINRIG